ncbi:bifunctional protein-serine/threonine kinase/phosphatase [Marinobacter mangrovi]|uniref:bifunctional protein-serine/threonine kinase/phosphatase n=1 Tax=Marinobacter mangrovi TaxID=2803918 RepID=UPI001932109D|nr:bifunctional protein-serine/threonine kinase/phosphatase [Marinobacter mangrovi]
MENRLTIALGQHTDRGRKPTNQDFHGCQIPTGAMRDLKGIALAMADGISSSDVSHIASETAVRAFLDDYYCTSDAWSVRHAVERVLTATNGWLHSQTQRSDARFDKNRGYVCTLSALVLKADRAHLFHVGDTRIYRLNDAGLEQLTHDHRLWVSPEEHYLSRALGIEASIELDYRSVSIRPGDLFILATDGVYEHAETAFILQCCREYAEDLDEAARRIIDHALDNGSRDNLTLQIVRVDSIPRDTTPDFHATIADLPLPPVLEARASFDGYTILRELHATSRSHVYLAEDQVSGERVVLKLPSIDLQQDEDYLERLLMEEWIARRVHSAHVMKAGPQTRQRQYLYTVTEYIEGQTLKQWLNDHPQPDLETVRDLVEQISKGLYALHRMEILHQDLKPDNVMIDTHGTVRLIDLGVARVAGIEEARTDDDPLALPGTALYMAPEYFMGEVGTARSDLYSLAVLTYHLLSGRFPYGPQVAKAKTAAAQRNLKYQSVLDDERTIPAWVDETLKKALHPNPDKRYQELSEFTYDLRHPNKAYLNKTRPPLLERNPVAVWQGISAVLAAAVVYLLVR